MEEGRNERLSEWMLLLTEGAQNVCYGIGDEEISQGENDARGDLVHLLVRCKESIQGQTPTLEPFATFLQGNRDLAEAWLDGYYVYELLRAIPDVIRRTLQLSILEATTIPSEQTTRYISEASRCYIQGFIIATVAMARAALEQAMKELFERLGYSSLSGCELKVLIKNAEDMHIVLSPDSIRIARDLVYKCNAVMHKRPPRSQDLAWEILVGIRSLLTEIYSSTVG